MRFRQHGVFRGKFPLRRKVNTGLVAGAMPQCRKWWASSGVANNAGKRPQRVDLWNRSSAEARPPHLPTDDRADDNPRKEGIVSNDDF